MSNLPVKEKLLQEFSSNLKIVEADKILQIEFIKRFNILKIKIIKIEQKEVREIFQSTKKNRESEMSVKIEKQN